MNKVTIIRGTTRPDSKSTLVSAHISNYLNTAHDVELSVVDPSMYKLKYDSDRDEAWDELTSVTDAFIIVLPEYNRGYPGSLKQLLDAQYENYSNKPVLLVGVSSGPFGGARAVENILPVLRELDMITTHRSAYVRDAGTDFDESGKLVDKQASQLNKSLDEFVKGLSN